MASVEQISITPLECGATREPLGVLEAGREGIGDLPAYAYLIEHPGRGVVVLEAGLPPRLHGGVFLGLKFETPHMVAGGGGAVPGGRGSQFQHRRCTDHRRWSSGLSHQGRAE